MADARITFKIVTQLSGTTDNEKAAMQASAIADHDYFVIQNVTDVDKMRDEAYRRQQGDYYAKVSQSSVIHHHRLMDKCLGADSVDQRHEVWLKKEIK